jgi:hypothetical protein
MRECRRRIKRCVATVTVTIAALQVLLTVCAAELKRYLGVGKALEPAGTYNQYQTENLLCWQQRSRTIVKLATF